MKQRNIAADDGSVSTEMAAIMAAVLAGFVLLVVFAGRVAQAENDVRSAAQEAARAASQTGSAGTAQVEAQRVVEANLITSGMSCRDGLEVTVGLERFEPGGWVSVTVVCHASFGDVASLDVPGRRAFTATSTAVIDTYRADNP